MTTPEFAAACGTKPYRIQKLLDRNQLARPPKIVTLTRTGIKHLRYDWPESRVEEVRAVLALGAGRRLAGMEKAREAARRDGGARRVCRAGLRYRDGSQRLCVLRDEDCPACQASRTVESVAGRTGSSAGTAVDAAVDMSRLWR